MKNRLDKNKYLRRLKFKRLWRRYERYVYLGVSCLMIVVLGIYFAYSKFSVSKEEEVIRTTVGNFIHGDVVIGAYVDGEYSLTIPSKNDGYVVKNIVCDNDATGIWDNDNWGLLTTNMTKRTKCNIYFEDNKPRLMDKIIELSNEKLDDFDTSDTMTDSKYLDGDSNIRYIGADPSNYVYFNCSDYNNQSDSTCEKWRIIGVFNNVNKSDGTKENLVKIIRDESIGDYAWDDNGTNDWSTATLQTYLNSGIYYTTTLKNDITRNAIENVVWNLGGLSQDDVNNAIVKKFYSSEKSENVYSGSSTTWTGKIGLMYPSDYGYAANAPDRFICLCDTLSFWQDECTKNDYLYKSDYTQWTIMQGISHITDVVRIFEDGSINLDDISSKYSVRPTLYLKSNITINSGDGSSNKPYQLNL